MPQPSTGIQRNSLKAILYAPYRKRFSGPDAYPLHDHDRFGEIFWCDHGRLTHVVNDTEIQMETGDIVFIRPDDKHRFASPRNRPFDLMIVCFSWHIYESFRQRYYPNDALYGETEDLPKMLHLNTKHLQWMRRMFFELYQAPRAPFYIDHYLSSVFFELGLIPQHKQLSLASFPEWMHKALIMIRDPERFRLGTPEFFRLCGRCPEHVSRVFSRITGEAPSKYLMRLRMEYAANLLSVTTENILDIGHACGMESMSHFYSVFRSFYNSTPRAYRINAQKRKAGGENKGI